MWRVDFSSCFVDSGSCPDVNPINIKIQNKAPYRFIFRILSNKKIGVIRFRSFLLRVILLSFEQTREVAFYKAGGLLPCNALGMIPYMITTRFAAHNPAKLPSLSILYIGYANSCYCSFLVFNRFQGKFNVKS